MDFKKRAISSIVRRKGKSVILFLVVFILGNVIAGAVAIQQSTTNVEVETKKKMRPVATVEMDYEAYEKEMSAAAAGEDQAINEPKVKDYEKISKLPYVKRYNLFISSGVGTNKLKGVTDPNGGMSYGGSSKYMFSLKGYNNKDILDVSEGLIKLTEGDGFTDNDIKKGSDAVIISQEVAEKNNLSVGDNFVLDAVVEVMMEAEDTEASEEEALQMQPKSATFDQPMRVAGIFNVVQKKADTQQTEEQRSDKEWRALEQMNTIYTTEGAAKAIQKKSDEKMGTSTDEGSAGEESIYYETTYVLKSSEDMDAFREAADALLPEYYHVVASTDQYEQVAGGLTKLNTIAKYIVVVAVVATLLILSLVVLLFLRDRKHELGIYLSFGESRGKVIAQIVLELLLISSVALLFSLITGNFLGGAISRSLIQSDWISNAAQSDQYFYMNNLMQSDLSFSDIQQAYKVTFSFGYILTYLLVGLGTVLISAILPLLYILRLNPKKIMM